MIGSSYSVPECDRKATPTTFGPCGHLGKNGRTGLNIRLEPRATGLVGLVYAQKIPHIPTKSNSIKITVYILMQSVSYPNYYGICRQYFFVGVFTGRS